MMMTKASLRITPLSTVAKVISGFAFKSAEFCESGIPVIKIKNIQLGEVDLAETQCVPEKYLSIDSKYHVHQGDILISLTGSHINQPNSVVGRVARYKKGVPKALLNQRAGKVLIRRPEKCDAGFLYYQLYDENIRRDIAAFAHGAANQANVSPSQIESLCIHLPLLPTQRKIAAILSVYDDLIENNLRRIKILEEMAQNLYREWFVKFRFPGHQRTRFTDSPLGRIPEGWEVKRLGDAFLIVLGGTPSRNRPEFWRNGTVPWINSGKVNDLRVTEPSELITQLALKKSAAKLMPPGTTLIAITGATLGQVSILEIEASANQSVVGIISEDENLIEWLHLTIRERISSIINHASGGAQQHINKGIVDDVVVAVPPGNIVEKFRNIVHLVYRQIAGLIFKNTALRRTRDLLLPRLISGEVDVSELDIAVPEEAEA